MLDCLLFYTTQFYDIHVCLFICIFTVAQTCKAHDVTLNNTATAKHLIETPPRSKISDTEKFICIIESNTISSQ